MMDVLLTGGDTELGRIIAEGFRDAGHQVVIAGSRRDELEVAAKELDVDSIVFDNTDPASLEEARAQFPHHLDTIVNVPAHRWDGGDPRTYTLTERAAAWRDGDGRHGALGRADRADPRRPPALRRDRSSTSSATTPPRAAPRPRSRPRCRIGLRDRQLTSASGASPSTRSRRAGAPNPGTTASRRTSPSVAAEITRLALFLTTPAARHITGQTLHVSHGALASFA